MDYPTEIYLTPDKWGDQCAFSYKGALEVLESIRSNVQDDADIDDFVQSNEIVEVDGHVYFTAEPIHGSRMKLLGWNVFEWVGNGKKAPHIGGNGEILHVGENLTKNVREWLDLD